MSYDSLFGAAPPKPPPTPRRRPPLGLVLLVLAVLGAAVVFFPLTRLAGLALVAALAVPATIYWRRERGGAGHWAATAALCVLGAAFLVGGSASLVSIGVLGPGSPRSSTPLPTDDLGPEADAGQLPPEPTAPLPPTAPFPTTAGPVPTAAPGLPAPPTPAPAARNTAPAPANTAPATTAPAPTQHVAKPKPTHQPAATPEPRRGEDDRNRDDTAPTTTKRDVDRSCQLGEVRENPDGSALVCAQPDPNGGFTWRRAERNEYENY